MLRQCVWCQNSIYFRANIKRIVYKHRGLKIGRFIRRPNQKSEVVSVAVVVEAVSEIVAGVAGVTGVAGSMALTCRLPRGHCAAICPCSRHLKQLLVQASSMRSWGVSLVYWRAASTLIGVWPCGAVVARAEPVAAACIA